MATTALAFAGAMAAAPASAADTLSVGVGGYMEQWFGYANRGDARDDGGFDVQSDSEIYFQGSMESDMGLTFTVHVQLEANNDSVTAADADGKEVKTDETEIDESFARVSGEFGTIEIGQRDPIHARTHTAAAGGAGVGLNAGDTQKWVPGAYLETAGWLHDNLNVIYISPRVNGVQVGLSYGPDAGSENSTASAPENNDDSVWAAGVNFNETIGDMAVSVSLGHLSRSYSTGAMVDIDGDNETKLTAADKKADDVMKGHDDQSFTNAGISLGMGAFTFSASYATRDDGKYKAVCEVTTAITAVDATATAEETKAAAVGDVVPCTQNGLVIDGAGSGTVNATHSFVEDESGQSDTWAVGIGYTDGPMSVSIGHMSHERENGTERVATMLSAGYTLAPGVAWKSSIFGVEDDTDTTKGMAEGTVFVTGIDIDF